MLYPCSPKEARENLMRQPLQWVDLAEILKICCHFLYCKIFVFLFPIILLHGKLKSLGLRMEPDLDFCTTCSTSCPTVELDSRESPPSPHWTAQSRDIPQSLNWLALSPDPPPHPDLKILYSFIYSCTEVGVLEGNYKEKNNLLYTCNMHDELVVVDVSGQVTRSAILAGSSPRGPIAWTPDQLISQ
jgi:hypothetical protein